MPSAFTLFGTLQADTKSFENSLRSADQRLAETSKNVTGLEQKTTGLGQTSAIAARGIEKFNESIARIRANLAESAGGFARGQIGATQMAGAVKSAENALNSLNSKIKDSNARLTDFANKAVDVKAKLQSVAEGISNVGQKMTIALTAPITALGAFSVKAASSFDDIKNRLNAATGSAEAGAKKFKELFNLSQNNVGVFTEFAAETYSLLKPLKITEDSINELIKSFGRLKLQNPELPISQFARNLQQIFSSLDKQDIKEAFERFPRFGEILGKVFNFDDTTISGVKENLKKIKEEGLTFQEFINKFNEGIKTDPSLGSLGETISTRFAKAFEKIQLAAVPLGEKLVGIFESFVPHIVSTIQYLSQAFISLSPIMQNVVIAIGGIAAAIGPILVVIGSLVTAITAVAGSAGTIAIVAGALAALSVPLGVMAGWAVALYTAWQENFGGIRDTTNMVLDFIQSKIEAFSAAAQAFWTKYGDAILEHARVTWEAIKGVIEQTLLIIGDVIKMGIQVMNGDWSGAWKSFLEIVEGNSALISKIIKGLIDFTYTAFKALVPIIADIGSQIFNTLVSWLTKAVTAIIDLFVNLPIRLIQLVPLLFNAGLDLGLAIWNGVKAGLTDGLKQIAPAIAKVSPAALAAQSLAARTSAPITAVAAGVGASAGMGITQAAEKATKAVKEKGGQWSMKETSQKIIDVNAETLKKVTELGMKGNVIVSSSDFSIDSVTGKIGNLLKTQYFDTTGDKLLNKIGNLEYKQPKTIEDVIAHLGEALDGGQMKVKIDDAFINLYVSRGITVGSSSRPNTNSVKKGR